MEGRTSLEEAREIFGANFIGIDELQLLSGFIPLMLPDVEQSIPYSKEYLINKGSDYILIFGVSKVKNLDNLDLIYLRNRFGINPDISEPCFYNQDWYLKEDFVNIHLEDKWYLIKKSIFEETRAVLPSELINNYSFPSAILCAYTFFIYWFHASEILWKYDFVWCSDLDHNGDRIYIGKYVDIHKINRNGFSVHRHLALRKTYGSITIA